eukprot:g14679.t1
MVKTEEEVVLVSDDTIRRDFDGSGRGRKRKGRVLPSSWRTKLVVMPYGAGAAGSVEAREPAQPMATMMMRLSWSLEMKEWQPGEQEVAAAAAVVVRKGEGRELR